MCLSLLSITWAASRAFYVFNVFAELKLRVCPSYREVGRVFLPLVYGCAVVLSSWGTVLGVLRIGVVAAAAACSALITFLVLYGASRDLKATLFALLMPYLSFGKSTDFAQVSKRPQLFLFVCLLLEQSPDSSSSLIRRCGTAPS